MTEVYDQREALYTAQQSAYQPQLSYGQRAVGLTFNPSASSEVDACKAAIAAEIDRMDALRLASLSREQAREHRHYRAAGCPDVGGQGSHVEGLTYGQQRAFARTGR